MSGTDTLWYKDSIFYEVHVRAFCDGDADGRGDLSGLISKLDYIKDLGVDCIWLLPIYPSPLKDDGYDISDFTSIAPAYGTLEDFHTLLDQAHARNLHVIMDLVLNHTSDQHPWFLAARADPKSHYRDYYVWSDTDQKYAGARIIFLDTEKSNWSWDEVAGQYFWHRFYTCQPDLNYDNPAVREEMINVMRFWLKMGIDGFRADAVPYLFEREGTDCENLPETHAYLKEIRRTLEREFPGRILLAEANQWPEDTRAYFGDGDEFHMGFHFPVMPRLYMAMRKADRTPLAWILGRTPPIPDNCQWCTFLRNHDELTLEMVTAEEREWMWQEYAPEPRMRLNLGIRRRLAPLLDNDRRKIELANSLLFTLPGSSILYYGDEIGMGDNIWLPDRNGVRTPMQWTSAVNAGFSTAAPKSLYLPVIDNSVYGPGHVNVTDERANPASLLNTIRRMIAIRNQHPAFGRGSFDWVECESLAVAAYLRQYGDETVLVVNNLSGKRQVMTFNLPFTAGQLVDLLKSSPLPLVQNSLITLELEPYQYIWATVE